MVGMANLTPLRIRKDFKFVDTKFIDDATAGVGRRPWTEEWTVRACRRDGRRYHAFYTGSDGHDHCGGINKTRRINP